VLGLGFVFFVINAVLAKTLLFARSLMSFLVRSLISSARQNVFFFPCVPGLFSGDLFLVVFLLLYGDGPVRFFSVTRITMNFPLSPLQTDLSFTPCRVDYDA